MQDWIKIQNNTEDQATIDITGVIGGSFFSEGITSEKVRSELKSIANLNAKKIIVNIDSPGGSIAHALSIHDLFAQHKAEIEVRIGGMAASSAAAIVMAGDKIKMSSNGLFLIHRATGAATGNADQIRAQAATIEKFESKLVNIHAKRTGKENSTIQNIMNENSGEGKWLDAIEAQEAGFVDEIFEPTKAAAKVNTTTLNQLGLPQLKNPTTMEITKDKILSWIEEKVKTITGNKPENEIKLLARTTIQTRPIPIRGI